MPGLHIDHVGGGSNAYSAPIEVTYNELSVLVANEKLVPGQRYLILDYQHKYLIGGSDTAPVSKEEVVYKTPYNYYIYLESNTALPYNSKVKITYLPESYAGGYKVGDVGRVTASYSDGGMYISGVPILVGIKLSYLNPFYKNPYIDNKVIRERFYAPLTGTITSAADTNIISGVGTLFTQELQPGDNLSYFVDGGYRYDRVIESITSDTELVITQQVLAADVATDVAFEKLTFGKEIMRPGGIVNTEVHNGEVYSGMSAAENPAPPIERIIIQAIAPNQLSTEAESATFSGDVMTYDFNDNKIINRSGVVIGIRPGNVTKRTNEKLKISINQDWRAHRFRRFRISDVDWPRLLFNQDLYKLDAGNQVYHVGGISQLSHIEEKRYLLTDVEKGFYFQDFTQNGTEENIFTSGYLGTDYTFYPTFDSQKLKYNNYAAIAASYFPNSEFWNEVSLNFNEIQCKDYFILPIVGNEPKDIVKEIKIEVLDNTVFKDLNQGQGTSEFIKIDCQEIKNSLFLTGGSLNSRNKAIDNFISFEGFEIENTGVLNNVINYSKLYLKNQGVLACSQFGGSANYPINFVGLASFVISSSSSVLHTVFGIGTTDRGFNIISETVCKDILFRYMSLGNNVIKIQGAFASIGNTEDHDYLNNSWFSISATAGCTIELKPGFYKQTGQEYWLTGAIRDIEIKTNPLTKELYHEQILGETRKIISLSKPTVLFADTVLEMAVDNAAPAAGDQVIFTLTAKCDMENYVTNAIVQALLPDGYTFVSEDTNGDYDSATGTWAVGDLPLGASKALKITVTVNAAGTYKFDGQISQDQSELNPEDNSATISVVPV